MSSGLALFDAHLQADIDQIWSLCVLRPIFVSSDRPASIAIAEHALRFKIANHSGRP